MIDIAVLINMPPAVRGFAKTTAEPDGDYQTVVVNARLTWEANRETYKHETKHIKEDDAHKNVDIGELEEVRHEKGNDNCNDDGDVLRSGSGGGAD